MNKDLALFGASDFTLGPSSVPARLYKTLKINPRFPASEVIHFETRVYFSEGRREGRLNRASPLLPDLLKECGRIQFPRRKLRPRESARQRSASLTRGAIFHALLNHEGSIFIVVTIVIDIVDDVKCSRERIIAAWIARGKESTEFRIVARNTRIQVATGV